MICVILAVTTDFYLLQTNSGKNETFMQQTNFFCKKRRPVGGGPSLGWEFIELFEENNEYSAREAEQEPVRCE